MTWFRIDDTWLTHPKVQAAGLKGRALWIAGGLYCAQHLTDGQIVKPAVKMLALLAGVPAKEADNLVALGMWIDEGDHYLMHNYLEYQPSREEVEGRRTKWARAKSLHDDRDLIKAVRKRDRDMCRYCAVPVNFKDRKGMTGGTYDHVDPEGANTMDNVVVACRKCSSAKGRRTPQQAGMDLLDLPESAAESAAPDLPGSTTHPGPARPPTDAAADHHQQPVVAADDGSGGGSTSNRTDAAIESIADYELEIAKGSGVTPEKTWPAYRAGIVKRLGRDRADIERLAVAWPDDTPDQLRDRYHGTAAYLAGADA